jgi:SAM-dependent methyltransferase
MPEENKIKVSAIAKEEAMTTQEREDTRPALDKIAPGYDEFVTPTHVWLANEGLRRADLRPGMRFLDVAGGSGALSIPAARLGAQVLAADMSPVMLERLKARARKRRRHRASALDPLGGRCLPRRREPADVLPPITAYYVMKIGTLPLIPYYRPGDKKLAEAVRAVAHKHHAVLLANDGPVVAGSSLSAAGAAI